MDLLIIKLNIRLYIAAAELCKKSHGTTTGSYYICIYIVRATFT